MFHFLAILTGLVEVLALSGLLYGWPAISEIFKREKVYEELCPQHSNCTCLEQDQAFIRVHSTATLVMGCSCLILGLIVDRFGVFVTRIYSIFFYLVSLISLLFIGRSSSMLWLFCLAFALASLCPLFTFLPLSRLFPKYKGTIVTIVNGIYDTSVSVTFLPLYAYTNGWSFNSIVLAFGLILVFFSVRTFMVLPARNIPSSDKLPGSYFLWPNTPAGNCHKTQLPEDQTLISPDSESSAKFCSYLKEILNWDYCIYLYMYIILDTRVIMTFTIWPVVTENFFGNDQKEIDFANALFTKMNILSFLICPVPGFLVDRLHLPRVKTVSMLLVLIIAIEVSISFLPFLKGSSWPIHLMSILFPLGRTLFYGVDTLFLLEAFPPAKFGLCFGVANIFAAFFNYMSLNIIADNLEYILQIQGLLGLLSLSTLMLPIHFLRKKYASDIA